MLEIIVEFFVRLLFPLDRERSTVKAIETTIENYTFSSVFPAQIEEMQEHIQ